MKRLIKTLVRRFGYDVVRYVPSRPGVDAIADVATFLRTDRPVVLDVGANAGQTINAFRERLPDCLIHSFEPSRSTFALLENNAGHLPNVRLWNCALGATCGELTFLENDHSKMSSFLPLGKIGRGKIVSEYLVPVRTVDQFCEDENIAHVDVLKSDTQGFDLEVFRGAERTLESGRIDLVYFELNFGEIYEDLPRVSEFFDFFLDRDYVLVCLYEFHYHNRLATWTDALFVRKAHHEAICSD